MRHLPLALLLMACGPRKAAQTPQPAPMPAETPSEAEPTTAADPATAPPDRTETEEGLADGSACLAASDCGSGICEGEGCDADSPGVCASRERMCTMDLIQYCDCEGETFASSGSCAGRRYERRGRCEDTPATP